MASLIYLALQTHQNAKHTRALIHQGRIAGIRELAVAGTDADVAAAILSANGGTPTPQEVRQMQFRQFCAATFWRWKRLRGSCRPVVRQTLGSFSSV